MGARIAVCDDSAAVADFVREALEADGHTVFWAMDPVQLAVFVKDHVPQLFILDMQMPAGGGQAAAKHLRRQPECVRLPILIFSNMPVEYQAKVFADDEHVRFLQKPVDIRVLRQVVKEMLGTPEASRNSWE